MVKITEIQYISSPTIFKPGTHQEHLLQQLFSAVYVRTIGLSTHNATEKHVVSSLS